MLGNHGVVHDLLEHAPFILAALGIVAVVWRALRRTFNLLRTIDDGVDYLRREMSLNGGDSMRDRIDANGRDLERLNRCVADMKEQAGGRLDRIETHLGIVEPQVSDIHDAVVDGPDDG